MINIYSAGGKYFVWNAEDAMTLRKEHRIIGSLMGIYPTKPFQVQTKWLPLHLMQEEVKLLLDKGIVKLLQSPDKLTDATLIESYFSKREELCKEQISILKENRKREIISKSDEIYAGKKRKLLDSKTDSSENTKKIKGSVESSGIDSDKPYCVTTNTDKSTDANISLENSDNMNKIEKNIDGDSKSSVMCEDVPGLSSQNDSKDNSDVCHSISKDATKLSDSSKILDKEKIIELEIAKIPEVSRDLCMVQLFTECPWKNASAIGSLSYPPSEIEKLRYAVFKDLWEKNYYVTSGIKFGGDFLVYEGDPLKYHAIFIIVCILPSTKFQALDILTYGRLGHQVKKSVALASINDMGSVEYVSISWANDLS